MSHGFFINFSNCIHVNYLWPSFIDKIGLDRAQKAVRQALDLQRMHGSVGTLPVLFAETCGLALTTPELVYQQIGISCEEEGIVLIFSIKDKSLQLLFERV